MDLPRITVVTPSYNQANYLDMTIQSVLDQGYPNLEYIICDGGSKDHSVAVIQKYAHRLAFWCSEKDKGQTEAINKGFRRATGDLHCYINSDDTLEPGSLRAAGEASAKGAEWITGWVKFLEPGGDEWPQLPKAHDTRVDWFLSNPVCQQATFWSARFTRELGPFLEDMHFGFDYEFWMRLVFLGKAKPLLLRRCLGGYRLHEASKTISQWDAFEPEFKRVREMYWKYLTPEEQRIVTIKRRRKEYDQHRLSGWRAIKVADIPAAREHAREAFRRARLSIEAWKLMYCALRGH